MKRDHVIKKTYESELFAIFENASRVQNDTWRLYYENFEEKNRDFCEKYSKYLKIYAQAKPKVWSDHVRMIRYWNDGSVTEMMSQVATMWDLFGLKKWITVNDDGKTFSYPDELAMVTKILRHGNNLAQNIFPEILNNLTSRHAIRIKETRNPSGNIDWVKTINNNMRGGMITPIKFVTKSHDKIFETSENKLAILSIIILKNNVEKILHNSKLQKEIPKESSILTQLIHLNDLVEKLLHDPRIYSISKKYRNNADKKMDTKKFKNLLELVRADIEERKIKHNSQKSYKSLVNWIDDFPTENNIEHILGNKDAKTVKVNYDDSIDIIYELWAMLSIVHVLSKNNVKLLGEIYDKKGRSRGFNFSYKKIKFQLGYDKQFKYVSKEFKRVGEEIRPDFVLISNDQKFVPVVMDAKNYLESYDDQDAKRVSDAERILTNYRDVLQSEGYNTTSTIGFFPRQSDSWVGDTIQSVRIRLDPKNKKELEENLSKFYVDILSKKITELEEYENSKKMINDKNY